MNQRIQLGELDYEWQGEWGTFPDSVDFAHHGLAITKDGNILTGHKSESKLLLLSSEGICLKEIEVPVNSTHGICVAQVGGEERVWIADVTSSERFSSRVVLVDMNGKQLAEITAKDVGYGLNESFVPTAVSVDPNSGHLWVADGYGSSRVHCFDANQKRLFSLSGSPKVGTFSCPHWVFVDTRKGVSEVYVADRANDRVQIFSADGQFLRVIDKELSAPSVFSSFEDKLIIGELNARLVVLDKDDNIMGTIGDGTELLKKEGWPNRKSNDKSISPLSDIPQGKFNSPHGMAADTEGNIYVNEWLIGGRFTKLARVKA